MKHEIIPQWMGRSRLVCGDEAMIRLMNSHVLVAGLGGVGGIAAEMLVRAGIGNLTIVDGDTIEASNCNRQIVALQTHEGLNKTDVLSERLLNINPELNLTIITEYLKDEAIPKLIHSSKFDFVAECIDTLSPKVYLIKECVNAGIPVVSSMGAGGKIDPTRVVVTDISKTHTCNLAFYVRRRLKRMGIYKGLQVVFSAEQADPKKIIPAPEGNPKKSVIGTTSYMPNVFGCTVASVVIRNLGQLKPYSSGAVKKAKK